MKLVVGLGNPGPRYVGSRHNIGFEVVDRLAERWSIDVTRHHPKFDALFGDGMAAGQRVLLLKPLTFMNLSGRSVAAVVRFYKLERADLLVAYDDLDLPPGKLRLRAEGSAGGHNGMRDIVRQLGGMDFPRLRVGIGKVHRAATVGHVLSGFAPDERRVMDEAVVAAADAIEVWLRQGIVAAMNEFNRRDK
jgi:PTH1 family peptidyl-tRNA hydrolase